MHQAGIELLSSGGTAKVLTASNIPIIEVSEYTGFPEMMDGRVKTLHPKIHGGILGRRGTDDAIMKEHNIGPIDLVVVNLYPFEEMTKQSLPLDELIEFIDIGGPAMIRAAAKNFQDVLVVIDPADYPALMNAVSSKKPFTREERLAYARKVFARMAAYDGAISNYLYGLEGELPSVYSVQFRNGRMLRYGENPHQVAAVYGESGIGGSLPLQGKAMSYNNYLDVDAAVGLLREFDECAAVIVKHNNPCGVATGEIIRDVYIEQGCGSGLRRWHCSGQPGGYSRPGQRLPDLYRSACCPSFSEEARRYKTKETSAFFISPISEISGKNH